MPCGRCRRSTPAAPAAACTGWSAARGDWLAPHQAYDGLELQRAAQVGALQNVNQAPRVAQATRLDKQPAAGCKCLFDVVAKEREEPARGVCSSSLRACTDESHTAARQAARGCGAQAVAGRCREVWCPHLSGLTCRMICASAGVSSPLVTQHMQPPAIWRTDTPPPPLPAAAAAPPIAAPSTPTAPNSFTTTAQTSCGGFFATRWRSAVVLPAPREPVRIVTGTGRRSLRGGAGGSEASALPPDAPPDTPPDAMPRPGSFAARARPGAILLVSTSQWVCCTAAGRPENVRRSEITSCRRLLHQWHI